MGRRILRTHGLCVIHYFARSAVAWWLMPLTPDQEVGVRAPLGSNPAVSLSKAHLLPKSTGNTQEVAAPSQHDGKIVYRESTNYFA